MNRGSHIKLKVCGMKYGHNLKGLVALQPDFIGFIFYPKSPRYIIGSLTSEELKIVPSSIKKVGVFVNESISKVRSLALNYGMQMIQLHGDESSDYCRELKKEFEIVKAFPMTGDFNFSVLHEFEDKVDFFLFDTKTPKHGGSGLQFDWNILKRYKSKNPFFLSGGIGVDDMESILQLDLKELYAIDVNSRVETEPGLKNLELVEELMMGMKMRVGRLKSEDRSRETGDGKRKTEFGRRKMEE